MVNFTVTDLTPVGDLDIVQIEMQIDAVNPGGDTNYDASLSSQSSFGVRKEF